MGGITTQVWFADDAAAAAAAGSLADSLAWWKQLSTFGPGYGYYLNTSKPWLQLVVKENCYEAARTLFLILISTLQCPALKV